MSEIPHYNGSNFEIVRPSLESYSHLWNRDYRAKPLEVLSYGGGTQSTAMLCLILEGKLPRPDLILHADTGSELPETVEFLNEARRLCAKMNRPFVIVESHRGKLHEDYMSKGTLPIIGVRSCTMNFKIQPQRRFIREIVGRRNGKIMATFWLGITTDEEDRSIVKNKDAPNFGERQVQTDVKWVSLYYPLLDAFPMTRQEAIQINTNHGLEVGKSGCFCCPYAGSKHWLSLRDNNPDLWQLCLDMEEAKSIADTEKGRKGGRGLFRDRPLELIDTYNFRDDSTCDSGAGCFL
tara:strand:+ start:8315 stop:9193 length:879 start_codon:yes stop_codon:yes gene_type:complete